MQDSRGRIRGLLTVGGKPPAGGKVSSCCEDGHVVPDVNGAYTLEASSGWHELWFAAHGGVGDSRLVEFTAGETRIEAPMDLLPWPVINAARAGDRCPRHPDQKLRLCEAGASYALDDLEVFARYPFPGDANWGRCLPAFVGSGELLRCDTCAREAEKASEEDED